MMPLLWCDVETTGLDPLKDLILEVAFVATDENLQVQGEWTAVIHRHREDVEPLLNDVTREMHTKNGLVLDCACHHARSIEEVQKEVVLWMTLGGYTNRPLAGSNPGFDRKFLLAQMPEVAERIHYRSFDMNTLFYFFGIDKDKNRKTTHRAIEDIDEELAIVQEMHSDLFAGLAQEWIGRTLNPPSTNS